MLDIGIRFWAMVEIGPGCWLWTGVKDHKGYGRFHLLDKGRRRMVRAHRVAYELTCGPIPDGLEVMHACDNPQCVNPAHLSIGTHSENMQDAAAKGRICTIGKSRITHCPQGHSYSGSNLYVAPNGHRKCRECNRLHQRESYLAKNPTIVPRGPRAIRSGIEP